MSELVIFEGDQQPVEVLLNGETVWLTQVQVAELFDKNVRTINEHVGKNRAYCNNFETPLLASLPG